VAEVAAEAEAVSYSTMQILRTAILTSSLGGGKTGGGSGGSGGRSSPSSNAGGATRQGSGASRSYGGGYYGGGASTPYAAGSKTPKGLIAAPLLVGGAALLIFPGIWLYNVYPYHYNNPYRFYNQSYGNRTQKRDGQNETLPVTCLCEEYRVCGCDENDDPAYLNDLVGNGSYAALNKTLVTVADVDGKKNLVLNGTLPNGTTAPGGEDDEEGAAANLLATMPFGRFTGYYIMGSIALYAVVLL
jgi:hypothetical protein